MINLLCSKLFRNLRFCALIALLAAGGQRTFAKDAIEVLASGGALNVSTSGKNLPDLLDNLINKEAQFSVFQALPPGTPVDGNIRVFGIDRVLSVNYTEGVTTTTATVSSAITDLNRTFTGPTRADVEAQVKDFVKKDGSAELAKIMAALAKRSPVAPMQGNPNSSASLTAQNAFDQYGFPESRTRSEKANGGGKGINSPGLGFVADVGTADANGYKQQSYSLPLYFPIYTAKNERWGVRLDMPLNYTTIEGSEIYRIGMNLAVPIVIIGTLDQVTPWHWQVTPSGGTQATASLDLVTGGVLNNGGITSSLEYDLGSSFYDITLAMGNQFTAIESMEVSVGSYSFDPGVSTQIIKNGLKASIPIGKHWAFDVYGIDTRLLGANNYESGYETVGGTLGWRSNGGKGYYKVGVYANFASQYSSANLQLGAGWKF